LLRLKNNTNAAGDLKHKVLKLMPHEPKTNKKLPANLYREFLEVSVVLIVT